MPVYRHEKCGEIAFIYAHELQRGENVEAAYLTWPNGTTAALNDPFVCHHCGLPLRFGDVILEGEQAATAKEIRGMAD